MDSTDPADPTAVYLDRAVTVTSVAASPTGPFVPLDEPIEIPAGFYDTRVTEAGTEYTPIQGGDPILVPFKRNLETS